MEMMKMKHILKTLVGVGFTLGTANAQVVENFESSSTWTWSPWVQASAGNIGTQAAIAAYSGSFGYSGSTTSYPWFRRNDYIFGNTGDVLSAWVKGNQRNYLGFGSSTTGAWSFVLAPNTSQLIIQSNSGWGYSNTVATSYTYNTSAWYFLELTFNSPTSVTGRLYNASMVLQASVTTSPVGLTAGGIAMRVYCTTAGYFDDIGLNVAPLAINLLEFTGKEDEAKGVINLNWTTGNEKNNKYFVVEKSLDGEKFESIETLNGAGNSNIINEYSLTDQHPFSGQNYYRLRCVENNGVCSYSKIIAVNKKQKTGKGYHIFPTVSAGNFQLQIPESGKHQIYVSDLTGQLVHMFNVNTNSSFSETLDLSMLGPGGYIIACENSHVASRQKIFIEK